MFTSLLGSYRDYSRSKLNSQEWIEAKEWTCWDGGLNLAVRVEV